MISYDKYLSPLGRNLHESVLRKMGQVIASRGGDLISFAAGYPDPVGFPWDEFREIANELLSGKDGSVLQYGPTRGYRPLLESIIGVLDRRGITADISQVMTTSGSQQGLDLIARVLIAPGDAVLVEVPTYTGAIAAFRNAQCRLVGVQQDADGINLEELDAVCMRERAAGSRVNLLYLVPNFQNPAGILLSLDKRARLLEWAERRDILIVEDDPYGELYFEDVASAGETRPLKADDRRGRVIYLSTFSKTLAPGFRVAWVAAPGADCRAVRHGEAVDGFDVRHPRPARRAPVDRPRRAGSSGRAAAAAVPDAARRDGAGAARGAWRTAHVDRAEGRVLPVGEAAGRLRVRAAAGAGARAGRDLRHRQRVLRGRQRPRSHPAVVLVADARAHSRRRSASRSRCNPSRSPRRPQRRTAFS